MNSLMHATPFSLHALSAMLSSDESSLTSAAIHRAAGPELVEACRRYPDIITERCPTGDARITL